MARDRLQQQAADCFKRLAAFLNAYPDIRAHIDFELDAHDGYPTSVIGAGDPPPAPVLVYEGECREWVSADGTAYWKGAMHTSPGGVRKCGNQRPCPDHDTPVKLTSTEANALNRRASNDDRIMQAAIDTIRTALDRLAPVQRRHTQLPEPTICSNGSGREGQHVWGDPLCRQIADSQCFGMCLDCWARMGAWRKERGMEPVERSEPDYLAARNVARGPKGRFTAA